MPFSYAHQSFSCQNCGLFFNGNYQLFVQHSNICPANTFQYPSIADSKMVTSSTNQVSTFKTHGKCKSKCDCSNGQLQNQHQQNKSNIKTSGRHHQQRKRKNVPEKENIDPETLAKYKALEWEQRTGYWCQRCNIKFNTSDLLVDHMSKNVHTKSK